MSEGTGPEAPSITKPPPVSEPPSDLAPAPSAPPFDLASAPSAPSSDLASAPSAPSSGPAPAVGSDLASEPVSARDADDVRDADGARDIAGPSDSGEVVIVTEKYVATGELLVQWAPPIAAEVPRPRAFDGKALAAWALALAIVALIASLFTGWALPLAVGAVAVGIVSARRPVGRGIAGWAIALGVVAAIYSAGWLWWMFTQPAPALV